MTSSTTQQNGLVPAYTVGGRTIYTTQAEADAAKLPMGSRVRFTLHDGSSGEGVLVRVWLYEDQMFDVCLDDGSTRLVCFGLGDCLEVDARPV